MFAHGLIPSLKHGASIRPYANTLSEAWAGIRPWMNSTYSTNEFRECSSNIIEVRDHTNGENKSKQHKLKPERVANFEEGKRRVASNLRLYGGSECFSTSIRLA